MSKIVCIHGIAQQHKSEGKLRAEWDPAITEGLSRVAPLRTVPGLPTSYVFYGDLFLGASRHLAVGDPMLSEAEITEFEAELLAAWWLEASVTDPKVIAPDARTLLRTPGSVQAALRALSRSHFFAGIAMRAMLFDLRQVQLYFMDDHIRQEILARVRQAITPETRLVLAHSLGSVVAYEALCAEPDSPVRALVTMGSPLGIRSLIFDRLRPPPVVLGNNVTGTWPRSVGSWTNIADRGDVIALAKLLKPIFGDRIQDRIVNNGAHAHAVAGYLSSEAAGEAIWPHLSGEAVVDQGDGSTEAGVSATP